MENYPPYDPRLPAYVVPDRGMTYPSRPTQQLSQLHGDYSRNQYGIQYNAPEPKRRWPSKHTWAVIFVIAAAIALILTLAMITIGHKSSSTVPHLLNPSVSQVATPQPVAQPATAAQVAASLNCTNFVDHGPSQSGMDVDSGSCYIGGKPYAINTFVSKDVRNQWLKLAEPLGVVPAWETDTSVTYRSVS